ncbi:hypothetical protein ACVJF2_000003 [Bradyrhizobium sp. USDA 4519]
MKSAAAPADAGKPPLAVTHWRQFRDVLLT